MLASDDPRLQNDGGSKCLTVERGKYPSGVNTMQQILMIFLTLTAASSIKPTFSADKADKEKVDPRKYAIIKLADVDEDFAFQGEYTGTIKGDDGEESKLGVQVIARGGGKFDAVGYPGGLPGGGWNKEEKIHGQGVLKLEGDIKTAVFVKSDKGSATIRDGKMTIKNTDGQEVCVLKRVIRKSPTLGLKPPPGAVVLFDGTSPDNFKNGRIADDGYLMQGVTSKQNFQNFTYHMEFLLSYMPYARGQGRSNSGCYFQGRYEVQILDSFGLDGKNNECGGIYTIRDPSVNMCFPPLSWQTYDVEYTAAKFNADGKKADDAVVTIRHNGVIVQENVKLDHSTTGSPLKEGPQRGPIYLQDHSNPLRYRNIWLVERSAAGKPDEKGFVALFDGETLNGWHKNPAKIGHGTGGRWTVEDGAIAGEQDPPGSGNGGILLTDEKFGNFELMIDMKPDWGVCSGLFVRSNDKGQCIQMMVDYHDNGNVGHIYGEGTGGFNTRTFDIMGVYKDDEKKILTRLTTQPTTNKPPKAFSISGEDWVKVWKVGDWNTARVRVEGNPAKVTTWLNGVKVNQFDGTTFVQDRYDKKKVAEIIGDRGSVAVQVHGGKGWPNGAKCRWKNIKIKRLD